MTDRVVVCSRRVGTGLFGSRDSNPGGKGDDDVARAACNRLVGFCDSPIGKTVDVVLLEKSPFTSCRVDQAGFGRYW